MQIFRSLCVLEYCIANVCYAEIGLRIEYGAFVMKSTMTFIL